MKSFKKIFFLLFLSFTFIFAQTKWIEPNQIICENNGGKTESKDGPCFATWKNAKKICEIMNLKLPSIEELEKVIKKCKGKLDDREKNVSNKQYQLCYQKKGFVGSFFYWSSSKAKAQLGHLGMQFKQGYTGFANDFYNLNIKCINSSNKEN